MKGWLIRRSWCNENWHWKSKPYDSVSTTNPTWSDLGSDDDDDDNNNNNNNNNNDHWKIVQDFNPRQGGVQLPACVLNLRDLCQNFLWGSIVKNFLTCSKTCCRVELHVITLFGTSGTAVIIVYDAVRSSSTLPGTVGTDGELYSYGNNTEASFTGNNIMPTDKTNCWSGHGLLLLSRVLLPMSSYLPRRGSRCSSCCILFFVCLSRTAVRSLEVVSLKKGTSENLINGQRKL
jgi:hypothetical protein